MQFLTILLINIFTGALIYLLLSLKIARSSAEYREQRLRREMDEIIKEFNSTANRNISILENKIAVINRLMRESGSIKGIDITVTNDEFVDNSRQVLEEEIPSVPSVSGSENQIPVKPVAETANGEAKKSLPGVILHGIDMIRSKIAGLAAGIEAPAEPAASFGAIMSNVQKVDQEPEESLDTNEKLIEKDLSSLEINDINGADAHDIEQEIEEASGEVTEEDILAILARENDKFITVSELEGLGCSIETIARYCNMPAGEVRLILNLQK